MSMKKFVIAGCILMFALMVSAQNQGGQGGQRFGMSEEERAKWYEDVKKELKITTAQLDSIKKFDAEFTPKQRELFEKYRDDPEGRREATTKLREQQDAKLKKVLTTEQFTKYQEFRRQRMQRPGGGGGGNR